jgi:DnaJ-class molecular chaperone
VRRSHYDTLGIDRKADEQAVKRAYRRKAAQSRGGNAAHMAKLNQAYEVLGTPERRLLYDQTGCDQKANPIETDARDVVMKVFMQLLEADDSVDILEHAKGALRGKLNEITQSIVVTKSKLEHLKKRRNKIKSRSGKNLFHMMIDQQLAGMAYGITNGERLSAVVMRALEILESYESEAAAMNYARIEIGSGSTWGRW